MKKFYPIPIIHQRFRVDEVNFQKIQPFEQYKQTLIMLNLMPEYLQYDSDVRNSKWSDMKIYSPQLNLFRRQTSI